MAFKNLKSRFNKPVDMKTYLERWIERFDEVLYVEVDDSMKLTRKKDGVK